jgi:hypothetical protein
MYLYNLLDICKNKEEITYESKDKREKEQRFNFTVSSPYQGHQHIMHIAMATDR